MWHTFSGKSRFQFQILFVVIIFIQYDSVILFYSSLPFTIFYKHCTLCKCFWRKQNAKWLRVNYCIAICKHTFFICQTFHLRIHFRESLCPNTFIAHNKPMLHMECSNVRLLSGMSSLLLPVISKLHHHSSSACMGTAISGRFAQSLRDGRAR